MTQQAVQLGYLPRVRIVHTSDETRGQVFAPAVNLLLFLAVIALVLGFRSSAALAAAFGLAVTATMVLTTLMIGFVVFRIWRWNPILSVPLYAVLLVLDLGLFTASATKFLDGGWLPVTDRRNSCPPLHHLAPGTRAVGGTLGRRRHVGRSAPEIDSGRAAHSGDSGLSDLKPSKACRPRSCITSRPIMSCTRAFCLLRSKRHLRRASNQEARLSEEDLGGGVTRVVIRYGFSEAPNVPGALSALKDGFDPMKATYFLSRQTLVPSRRPGMALWREHLFAAMMRNSQSPMSYFKLPVNKVVELGSQVEI